MGAGSLDGRGQGPCPARRRSRTTTSARPPYGWPSRPSALTTRRVAVGAAGRGAQRARAHAEHAARILRTWFVDPATRTNPEPGNAQAIPCRYDGRAIGIIDLSQGLRRPARGRPPLDRTGPRRHAGLGGRVPRLAGGRRLRQAEGFRRQQPRRLPPHAGRSARRRHLPHRARPADRRRRTHRADQPSDRRRRGPAAGTRAHPQPALLGLQSGGLHPARRRGRPRRSAAPHGTGGLLTAPGRGLPAAGRHRRRTRAPPRAGLSRLRRLRRRPRRRRPR